MDELKHPLMEKAIALDSEDPLRPYRAEFVIDDPELIYLDGNSLGRLPKRTVELLDGLIRQQWGSRLIRAWGESWIDLPARLSSKIAQLIGADADEVLVADSTSVNFYKLVMATLSQVQGDKCIITDSSNFPSDLYLLQGCSASTGNPLRVVEPTELLASIDADTALVTLSHVSFKSGFIQPMQAVTERAHEVGAYVIWDLSHSVGAMPMSLRDSNVDMAVGCTYKYLNGGPGAPAFLYLRKDLQEDWMSPIWGWFGQDHPFDFTLDYTPAPGIQCFAAGTPSILSMAAIEPGVDLILQAGLAAIRMKSVLQTRFLIELWETILAPLGVTLNSPTADLERGSHVSFGHPCAFQIDQALIEEMKVIPDFRTPDNIRFGVTPLTTTFGELCQGVLRMERVVRDKRYERYPSRGFGVT